MVLEKDVKTKKKIGTVMSRQMNIFDREVDDTAKLSNQLELSKVKVKVSDNQLAIDINKIIKKIDTLDSRIKKVKEDVVYVNEIYEKEIKPIESIYLNQKLEFVRNLLNFISKKNIPQKYQEEALHQINVNMEVLNLSDFITEEVRLELGDKLDELQSKYDVNFDSGAKKEMDFDMMQEAFENESGVDLDLDFSDFEHLTIDQIEEMFRQRFANHFHEQQSKSSQKRKRNNQNIDDHYFKKIYKNLVKKLHPDLQTDVSDGDKNELILLLTSAWEKRDYLKLLEINQLLEGEVDYDLMPENVLEKFRLSLKEKLNLRESEYQEIKEGRTKEYHWYNLLYQKRKNAVPQNVAYIISQLEEATTELKEDNRIVFKSVKSTKDYLGKTIEDTWFSTEKEKEENTEYDEDYLEFFEEFMS